MKILNFVLSALCFSTVIPSISSMDNLTTFEKNERLDAISTRNQVRNTKNLIDQMRQQPDIGSNLAETTQKLQEQLKESKKRFEEGNLEYEQAKLEQKKKSEEITKKLESLNDFKFAPINRDNIFKSLNIDEKESEDSQ